MKKIKNAPEGVPDTRTCISNYLLGGAVSSTEGLIASQPAHDHMERSVSYYIRVVWKEAWRPVEGYLFCLALQGVSSARL